MTRTNYRVLAYYEDDCYSNEVYMFIINARSEEEINTYFENGDLYWEILDEDECCTLSDIIRADSVLIEGVRFYKDHDSRYESAIKLIGMLY